MVGLGLEQEVILAAVLLGVDVVVRPVAVHSTIQTSHDPVTMQSQRSNRFARRFNIMGGLLFRTEAGDANLFENLCKFCDCIVTGS